MKAEKWDVSVHGLLSEEAIRELHRPAADHRISPSTYEPGTRFAGAMRRGRVYVLSGRCSYSFRTGTIRVSAGEFCDLDEGDFDFEVLSEHRCMLVLVWDLSGFFRMAEGKLPH